MEKPVKRKAAKKGATNNDKPVTLVGKFKNMIALAATIKEANMKSK